MSQWRNERERTSFTWAKNENGDRNMREGEEEVVYLFIWLLEEFQVP